MQLPGHLDSAHRVTAKKLRVAMNKGRAKCGSQQQNKRDCGQSPVGDRDALSLLGGGLGADSTISSCRFGLRALPLLGAGLGAGSNFDSFHFGPRARTRLGGG